MRIMNKLPLIIACLACTGFAAALRHVSVETIEVLNMQNKNALILAAASYYKGCTDNASERKLKEHSCYELSQQYYAQTKEIFDEIDRMSSKSGK